MYKFSSKESKEIIFELLNMQLEEIEIQLKSNPIFFKTLKEAFLIVNFASSFDKKFTENLSDADLEKIIKTLTFMDQRDCRGSVTGIPYLIYLLKSRSDPYAQFIDSSYKYWDWGDKFNETEAWVLQHNTHKNPYLPSQSSPEELTAKRLYKEQRAILEEADVKRQTEDKKKRIEKASKDIWKAIQRKDLKAIRGLIEKGADINQFNDSGTALSELIQNLGVRL
jgi:predicted GIY-YIG superfamily endonuclease